MNLSDLEGPFHATRAISVVAELFVIIIVFVVIITIIIIIITSAKKVTFFLRLIGWLVS